MKSKCNQKPKLHDGPCETCQFTSYKKDNMCHCLTCPIGVFCHSLNPRPEFYFCPTCGTPVAFKNLERQRKASMKVWLSGIPIPHCTAIRQIEEPCRFCFEAKYKGEDRQQFVVPSEVMPDNRVPRGRLIDKLLGNVKGPSGGKRTTQSRSGSPAPAGI